MNHATHPVLWSCVLAAAMVVTWRPRAPVRRIRPAEPPELAETTPRRQRGADGVPSRPSPIADRMALAHWCEGIARSLRSGSTLAIAATASPPPKAFELEIDIVTTSLMRGRALDPTSSTPHPDVALVTGVLAACAEHGGPAAEPLDRVASVLRGRAAEAAERRTQSAQARLSARVMTVLPLAMLGLLLVSSASVRHVITTSAGVGTIALGAVLNLAGWRWLRRLVDGASV